MGSKAQTDFIERIRRKGRVFNEFRAAAATMNIGILPPGPIEFEPAGRTPATDKNLMPPPKTGGFGVTGDE